MNLVTIVAIIGILFVLTYQPKKSDYTEKQQPEQGCSVLDYMARNFVQCEPPHYQGVQFGNPDYPTPSRHPKAYMGAIIGT